MFPFVVDFIDRSTWQKRSLHMTSVHTLYNEIVCDLKRDVEQQIWDEKELGRLYRTVNQFKTILVEKFNQYCDSGLDTLKYHLLDHMVEDLQRFGTLSVKDSIFV